MLFSPRGVSAGCIYAFIHVLGVLSAYRLASLFLMLSSPRCVSAACIYALIYILGVLFTYRLASLLQMLFSPRRVCAACIYASIHVLGVLSTYRLTAAQESLNLRKHPCRDGCTGKPQAPLPNNAIIIRVSVYGFPACFACKCRSAYRVTGSALWQGEGSHSTAFCGRTDTRIQI
jgi:xanthosine utilization system XapX-like protein